MSKTPVVIGRFGGGWSTDLKDGQENSFAYSRHVEFRKNPTLLSIKPKTAKETSTTVDQLVTEMVQLPSGKVVGIGATGGVYIRATNGTWSKDGTALNDTMFGAVYNRQHDRIYVPGGKVVHAILNADGRFSGGVFTPTSSVIGPLVDQSATNSTNTYTTTTAINEGATHKLELIPNIEPLYSVKLWITTKGTGDVILVMHDAANNELGRVTKTAASLTNGQLNEFVFSTPPRMNVKPGASTYHFHVIYDNGGGGTASTIGAATASDFSTARHDTLADRLVSPQNGFHPVKQFLQYICIGNERYLAVWEPISLSAPTRLEFEQHRLTFPAQYEVTSLALWNEYIAIACERRSSSGVVNSFSDGKIYFWNGIDTTYQFSLDIPSGAPYGLFSSNNVLYYFSGGTWWAYSGGNPVPIREMPNTNFDYSDGSFYAVVYPNAMAVKDKILLAAFPSETNSQAIEHGVYSFGVPNRLYEESFGLDYTVSTGTRFYNGTDALRIGAVKMLGDKLFISWQDSSQATANLRFGIDMVDANSNPFASATWESRIIDNGRPYRQKQATTYFIDTKTLPTGATITPKYKIDRASNWISGTAVVAGASQAKININKRYKEIQLAIDMVATTTTPEVISASLIWDPVAEESD